MSPDGLTVRPPTPDDLDVVVELGNAYERAFAGGEGFTREDVAGEWRRLDLDHDAWLVLTADGRPAGYASLEDRGDGRFQADGYVHPACRGLGVGALLVELSEARARELGGSHVSNATVGKDAVALRLLESRGYRELRRWYRMTIDLDDEPPEPAWPEGIRAEPFAAEDARAFHDAIEEAWQDHWDHRPRPFELFEERLLQGARYEPSLWTVAWADDEIAGGTICEEGVYGMGWVRSLSVRRPWRRQGLGMALLLHAFRRFHERGERRVGLGVDAESPTGATRLYERAGMRVVEEDVVFEKALGDS